MILTPLTLAEIPAVLESFETGLGDAVLARRALQRIGATLGHVRGSDITLSCDADLHDQAISLLAKFHLAAVDQPPSTGLTWDGRAVAIQMEPSVIIHEVAHYQLASPARASSGRLWHGGGSRIRT